MTSPRLRTILAVLACALGAFLVGRLVAGDGDDGKQPAGRASATVRPPAPAPSAATTPVPAAPARAIVSGEGGDSGATFRLSVTELRRSGSTVNVGAQLELLRDDSDRYQVANAFSDGRLQKLQDGATEGSDVFDGVALIDPEGRKKYLVARDADGRCVCSNDLASTFAEPDAPVRLQATLTAPPAGVREIDVYVPRVKTFTHVPLAD